MLAQLAAAPLDRASRALLRPDGGPRLDFARPLGEPALSSPDSVSWRLFKAPLALFIGGVAAVILELAEPRVSSGVWDHTSFRRDPVRRLRRTGLAAMVTVYGPCSLAEAMIARVGRLHAAIRGVTADGQPYAADDPELLDWVQATASFGFLQAYHAYVRPLSAAERDRFHAEGETSARLYGAFGAPRSEAELQRQLRAMADRLRGAPVIFEFLDILGAAPLLPAPLAPAQRMLVRAAVEILPPWARARLGLGPAYGLKPWEAALVRRAGALSDRLVLPSSPPVQACLRLGLPADYLYRPQAAARLQAKAG
jgi:uncharacterized protein (DUF2236 family)